ncbi:MAG: TIGR01212 family radical SAM protein [Solobacterium sp.]|nr:TIGR01212 family radical SAM protein [Solobacterium sp.]
MRTLSGVLKEQYGEKLYKLSLSSGCTCPVRDGTISKDGCTFCSAGGSGEFSVPFLPIEEQITLAKKNAAGKHAGSYIAYFQSYTNTYGDPSRLRELYTAAISFPEIRILSLGTRPDCLGDEMMELLIDLNRIKPVWVELGLQTIHEETAQRIGRGYPLSVYEEAIQKLKSAGITVIVHMIFSLPGESEEMMLESMRYLCDPSHRPDGVKLQMLNILKGSQMEEEYRNEPFPLLSQDTYTSLIVKAIQILPVDMVLHRMTGDGPKQLLVAPTWVCNKKAVLNEINRKLRALPVNPLR